MQTTSDGGGGPLQSVVTVPLMVQPEVLAQTAARLEEVATRLAICLGGTSAKLGPTPPGDDEVSTSSSAVLPPKERTPPNRSLRVLRSCARPQPTAARAPPSTSKPMSHSGRHYDVNRSQLGVAPDHAARE